MLFTVLMMMCIKVTSPQNKLSWNLHEDYMAQYAQFSSQQSEFNLKFKNCNTSSKYREDCRNRLTEKSIIISGNETIDSVDQKKELTRAFDNLHESLIRLKELKEKVFAVKKMCYFYKKVWDSLLSDMQAPYIVIIGCPQLKLHQLSSLLINLSKKLHIRFNDNNVCLLMQPQKEWRTSVDDIKSIPILVKLKTFKIKNLYLEAVRREMMMSKSVKKFGLSVHVGNQLFTGIFINEHLTPDRLNLYRFVYRESKRFGYKCFINNSNIFIRKSARHEPLIVKSKHIIRVLAQKRITQKMLNTTLEDTMVYEGTQRVD